MKYHTRSVWKLLYTKLREKSVGTVVPTDYTKLIVKAIKKLQQLWGAQRM